MLKCLGLLLVVGSASAVGFGFAGSVHRQLEQMRQMLTAIAYIKAEISYRMTPLEEIFTALASDISGAVGAFFAACAKRMQKERTSGMQDVFCLAMRDVQALRLPREAHGALVSLALVLGKFDVEGQCRALDLAAERMEKTIHELEENRHERCRSYRTIGICAGFAAAVILL